ncbi:MAG: Rid family hydrolase [Shimia sp.]
MAQKIRRIRSGGPFEEKVGYCRAVVAGGWVHVAGTVSDEAAEYTDVVEQCRSALRRIEVALSEAGAGFEHVVRVTYILPDIANFEACWPVLREAFGAHPPAATVYQAPLIDAADLIEIEVTAFIGER